MSNLFLVISIWWARLHNQHFEKKAINNMSLYLRFNLTYVKQIAILLTDGISNLAYEYTVPNAEEAANDGIEIFVIGK